jgi:UDP-glucose 4-epimerase
VQPLHASHLGNPNFESVEGDFSSEADVAGALADRDLCFHLVCTTLPKSSNADPVFDIESNLVGSVRMLENALRLGVKKVIFASSGGTVYGVPCQTPITEAHPTDPTCSYGITKLAIEKYLQLFSTLHGLNFAALRLANPYGPRQRLHSSQGAVAVFMGKVLRQEPIEIWGDGSVVRDYVHIHDVVDALLLAAETSVNGVFNIGSGQGRSLNELLNVIERVTGMTATRSYFPPRAFDVPVSVLDIDRAARLLRWAPKVTFEEGMKTFHDWLKADGRDL